jgi:hypothetical protein
MNGENSLSFADFDQPSNANGLLIQHLSDSNLLINVKEEFPLDVRNPSSREVKKYDYNNTYFLYRTLSVCEKINSALDTLKSGLGSRIQIRKEKVLNEKAKLIVLQPASSTASDGPFSLSDAICFETSESTRCAHNQSFSIRYSERKLDTVTQKLDLRFEASKNMSNSKKLSEVA